jgi:hypothetical protein
MNNLIIVRSTNTATVAQVVAKAHTIINSFSGGPIIAGGEAAPVRGETLVSSANLSGHRAIALVGGVAIYADCRIAEHAYLTMGVSESAVVLGANLLVFNRQPIEEPTWDWAPGQPVFLGQGGLLSQSVPVSPALFVLQVGIAVSAHRLDVDIQRPIFI